MSAINFEELLARNPCNQCLTPMQMAAVQVELLAELNEMLTTIEAGPLLVRGSMAIAYDQFTRPADTTAYAANDSVSTALGAVMTFTDVARIAGGSGYVTNVRLIKDEPTVTNAFFRLWLYSTAPTPVADNSPFTLLFTNRAIRLGYVDLVCTTEGTGSDSASALVTNVNLKFSCAAASRNLYGLLEAKQAYAPVASEIFWVELTVDQN